MLESQISACRPQSLTEVQQRSLNAMMHAQPSTGHVSVGSALGSTMGDVWVQGSKCPAALWQRMRSR